MGYKSVILLGPIGAGKTYISKQLTSQLEKNLIPYKTFNVFPILVELFGEKPGVVEEVINPYGRKVKKYTFTDEMLEEGYKEQARRIGKRMREKDEVIICEVATDTKFKVAVKWICDQFKAQGKEILLLYLQVPKEVCLERNRRRPDYISSREDVFFNHSESDIKKLAEENGVELKIRRNLNETDAQKIVEELLQELFD